MPGVALNSQSYRARSTNVTANELRLACESVTETIQNFGKRSLLGLRPTNITVELGPVTCVARATPTGIMTITISLSTSDGFAEVVTFDITLQNSELGGPGSNRWFYTAKADATDRLGSKHPTIKPTSLMQYMIRLVTPPGGLVLDPFAGSGSTGVAAVFENMSAILIEREPAFAADARRRVEWAQGNGRLTMLEKKQPKAKEPDPINRGFFD